jgi:hypothetical protein
MSAAPILTAGKTIWREVSRPFKWYWSRMIDSHLFVKTTVTATMVKDFGMVNHIVPITAPVQKTATFVTPHVALKKYERAKFLVLLGALATDSFTLTVTASSDNAGGTPTALSFKYRVTAAAGTDTLGDLSAAVTSLVLTHSTYGGKVVIIEVDADELTADKPYVGLTFTDPGSADAVIGVVAELKPRYPQATNDGALT